MTSSRAFVLILVAALGGCGPTVLYHRSPEVTIDPAMRWSWSPPDGDGLPAHEGALIPTDSIARLISEAIEAELAARGHVRTSPDSADFVVHYHLGRRTVVDTFPPRRDPLPVGDVRAPGSWGGHGDPEQLGERTIEWQEGLLVIDAVRLDGYRVAWRGLISGEVPASAGRDPGTPIRRAVRKVFRGFP